MSWSAEKIRKENSMENCIFDDATSDTIGFYADMKKGLRAQAVEYIDAGDYENASDVCEILLELESWREFGGLLVLSENNGMGWTIKEYKKGDENE